MLVAGSAWAGTNLGPVPNTNGANNLHQGVVAVVNAVLNFVALIVLVLIVISGFRLLLSQGDETARDSAKKTIIYLIIGLIVIVFAKAIANFIITTIGNA
jgi:heme/copper-type cytochrome/quinol oxidase subunit 2